MATVDLKDVDKLLEKYRRRLNFVAKDATQEVLAKASLERNQGGRMRVATGFLRASLLASTSGMPSGISSNPENRVFPEGSSIGTPVAATLIRWDPETQTLYCGWVANYARVREYQDGFMRGAVQMWQPIVEQSIQKAQRALP